MQTLDIFQRVAYINPSQVEIVNYVRKKPISMFNPGIVCFKDTITLFPRLVFDIYKYVSSIGCFSLSIEDILKGEIPDNISTNIILWPKELWNFRGCEDPRGHIINGKIVLLFTGAGYYYQDDGQLKARDYLGYAEFDDDYNIIRKGYFKIVDTSGEVYIPRSNKDSTIIRYFSSSAVMLTRPALLPPYFSLSPAPCTMCTGWRCNVDLENLEILAETLEPVLPLERWEIKAGWSTNAIKLSSNEYLVGWHALVREDLSYRNGLAMIDKDGYLLGITDYILTPMGLVEEYGDRPLVIFGDGLFLDKDRLYWIGGVSDYTIGIFATELDMVEENMRYLSG